MKNSNNFLMILGIACFGLALLIHQRLTRPIVHVEKQESATNINRNFLQLAAGGNKRLISNLIWIQTLLESDLERYEKRDLSNWMYLRFLTVATLDPQFYENYLWGGIYLSIIKDDIEGAADIYERGLKYYPEDYRLSYNAGFNYYFEMKDYVNGLRLLEKIADNPKAPAFLKFIVNKLRFETGGDYQTTLTFLQHQLELNKDPAIIKKLSSEIYALKAEHDLNCLNSGNATNCEKKDAFGEPYINENGSWRSKTEYRKFRVYRREQNK